MGTSDFWLFPIRKGTKLPAVKAWQEAASRTTRLRNDGTRGIYTGRYRDDQALVVVDVDVKPGKHGEESILALDMQGLELPVTMEQRTPSGGRHLFYSAPAACKQGVEVLGSGLDIRSRGGYVVLYGLDDTPVAPCPQWLIDRLGVEPEREASAEVLAGIDPDRARRRAAEWLATAPTSVEGEGGDITAFRVAARLKDFGVDPMTCLELLQEWNETCDPPWDDDELARKVDNAYAYGREPQGAAAPEAVFPKVEPPDTDVPEALHPFDELNREFAFIKKGCFVLQETTDDQGKFVTEHLNMAEFHGWFANVPFQAGNGRPRAISEHWLEWSQRRQYEGVVFAPEQDPGGRWYNMWRGFSVEPAATPDHPSVKAFCEHALANVCGGNEMLYTWLMGYFAHMVQRPYEKPLVALVFRGAKGTGKNALVERVGSLLGGHFMVADDDRYLLGNFNSHLESNLFFVLDEAAWAGDKRAEGRLKGLITGQHHNIERKGKEAYRVKNLTRVAIIGNEDWLVPATVDERRFAVFNVGDGRKQDRKFFEQMRVGMEQGGYAHLLAFLKAFPISDVNAAPVTAGLIDQKHASLDALPAWWYDSLSAGTLAGGDFGGDWPTLATTSRFRETFYRWAKGRNIKSRLPEDKAFGKILAKLAPSMKKTRPVVGGHQTYHYESDLDQLRADWAKFIGGSVTWDTP